MSQEKKNMAAQTTTQTPKPAPVGGKTGKPRKVDTREPHVIFAERFNTEARLMARRYNNLAALGGAKRAKPKPEQVEKVAEWLREQTERCIREMSRKLKAQDAQPSDDKPFAILGEAPAKVAQAPQPAKK